MPVQVLVRQLRVVLYPGILYQVWHDHVIELNLCRRVQMGRALH